ncbi:MAG: hypothetical protein COB49_07510 [Alphaproteobacteria bacterium]|nr:MAG: hypothetical protein COB49_07510 [Alphaproteobacteria bacterium]
MNKDLIEKIDLSLWENYDGPIPDDDSKLRPLWESAMMWTLDILAKELGVKKYDVGDGSENLEQDYVETVLNIINEAGYKKVLPNYAIVPVKRMRIMNHPMGCPEYIPFSILSEQWAQNNHGQTLDRLNERGGLAVYEALAIIERRDCHNIPDTTGTAMLNKHLNSMIKAGDEG